MVDAVLISVALSGIKRSTGLTPAIRKVPNKDVRNLLRVYLETGEWVSASSVLCCLCLACPGLCIVICLSRAPAGSFGEPCASGIVCESRAPSLTTSRRFSSWTSLSSSSVVPITLSASDERPQSSPAKGWMRPETKRVAPVTRDLATRLWRD